MYDIFFRNRRLLLLALSLITVTGLSSTVVLPRLEDPTLRQRASLIHTAFPGATAVRVEALVTEPLEDALKEIEEIRLIRSGTRNGLSTITIELQDRVYDVDTVWSRVRDKLNDVTPQIQAAGAEAPHFVDLKFTAYAMLISVHWERAGEGNEVIANRYAELLEQRLGILHGTDDVDLFGMAAEEIVVEVDQQKLASYGLTVDDVASALAASDAKVPAGGVRGDNNQVFIELSSEFDSLARVAATPIRVETGQQAVLLSDVASIEKAVQDPPETRSLVNGRQSVVVGCFVQPDIRIDLWTEDVRQLLQEFREELPEGLAVETIFMQEEYVTQRLTSLLMNLGLGGAAVILVLLVVMGWRSALIVGCALPLTSLLVLGGLRALSIPLHQMSVTGIIIALGLLIDNAIVAVDEMRYHLRRGDGPAAAIRNTVRHLAIPLFGSTFTTCLAFAPLALMPGPAGEFVGSIGLSVILAVTGSLFLSLTIIPALVGILRGRIEASTGTGTLQFGYGSEPLYAWYLNLLAWLFARPGWVLLAGVIGPFSGYLLITQLPEQFFPPSDRDQFQVVAQLPSHASIAQTEALAREAREIILAEPAVEANHWFIGESAPAFYYNMLPVRAALPNYAQSLVQVSDTTGITQLVRRLQSKLESRFPEAQIMVRQLEQGPPVDAPIMIRVFGPDLDTLRELGDRVRLIAADIPDVITTVSDAGSSNARISLAVDERRAQAAGLSQAAIAGQIRAAMDGSLGGSLIEGTEVIPVRIRLQSEQRGDRTELESFDLVSLSPDGAPVRVPVHSVARWELVPGDASIERINGYRMNEVQVHVKAGVLASTVLAEFRKRYEASDIVMPPGYTIDFAGESAERNRAVGNLLASAGVLGVLMVAGLVLSFQSFRLAAVIGIVGALSVGLGLQSLWVFGYPFGFMAIVGIMGLVGVAINDSIVVLAALAAEPDCQDGNIAAVSRVVFRSTRHVVATTLTTIAGFIPLIAGGGGFWPPLAVAVAGGVLGATGLALLFIPSAWIVLRRSRSSADSPSPSLSSAATNGSQV